MDIVVLLVLIIIILVIFKDTISIIYFLGIADVFMRLMHFIKSLINVPEFSKLINTYIPTSVVGIIENNTEGIITTIMEWVYVIVIVLFLFYLVKYLFKRR